MCSHVMLSRAYKSAFNFNFCYVSSFQIMATSTYGSANGGLVKSTKMKSVKAISSVVSEKQGIRNGKYVFIGNEKYSYFIDSMWKDISAAQAACDSIDNTETVKILDVLENSEGILVSGMGKSGIVGQRLSASLVSIGCLSNYVHGAEWGHGDLGRARPGKDVALFFSHSGNTDECVKAATHLNQRGVTTLCIVGNKDSKLSKTCDYCLHYKSDNMQEPFKLVPTCSIVVQEMISNAILRDLMQRKSVTRDMFRDNHPGGSIGRILSQMK